MRPRRFLRTKREILTSEYYVITQRPIVSVGIEIMISKWRPRVLALRSPPEVRRDDPPMGLRSHSNESSAEIHDGLVRVVTELPLLRSSSQSNELAPRLPPRGFPLTGTR